MDAGGSLDCVLSLITVSISSPTDSGFVVCVRAREGNVSSLELEVPCRGKGNGVDCN